MMADRFALAFSLIGLTAQAVAGQSALFTVEAMEQGAGFGSTVVGAGDVDGDGHDDILVGGHCTNQVWLFSGKDGLTLRSWQGDRASDGFGHAICVAGDVNQDGFPDILVGAPQPHSGRGYVTLISGADGTRVRRIDGIANGGLFGFSVHGGTDLDGDGIPDIVVGAPNAGLAVQSPAVGASAASDVPVRTGSICAYSGATGLQLWTLSGFATSTKMPDGTTWAANLGICVGGGSDTNGDGSPDIIASTYRSRTVNIYSGEVLAISGKSGEAIRTLTGPGAPNASDDFGRWVSSPGDVDGDGMADILVGAHDLMIQPGTVYMFSGEDGKVLWEVQGEWSPDRPLIKNNVGKMVRDNSGSDTDFGVSHAKLPDVDGDGVHDVLVGAVRYKKQSGYASILSGRTGKLILRVGSRTEARFFGASVAYVGDVNADGYPDIAVGAPARFPLFIGESLDSELRPCIANAEAARFRVRLEANHSATESQNHLGYVRVISLRDIANKTTQARDDR